jgi:hypothetical protein
VSLAVVVLLLAALVVALALGTGRSVGMAAVVALVGGAAATRIVVNEMARVRRDGARSLAEQAVSYRQLSRRAAAEHLRFAAAMGARLAAREEATVRVRRALRVAMRRADAADRQATVAAVRGGELEQELARLQLALRDRVSADEAAEQDRAAVPSVVDLVGWEQRSAGAAVAGRDGRRPA